MRIRALSLHRPWGELIIAGLKTVETRGWKHLPVCLVGNRLAIHSAQQLDKGSLLVLRRALGAAHLRALFERGLVDCYNRADTQTGIIGHVRVTGVRALIGNALERGAALCNCWGRIGICVDDPVRLREPIICPGRQRFWWVEIPD